MSPGAPDWTIPGRRKHSALEEFSFLAKDYGFPSILVDGKDVVAVWRAAQESIHRARNGSWPDAHRVPDRAGKFQGPTGAHAALHEQARRVGMMGGSSKSSIRSNRDRGGDAAAMLSVFTCFAPTLSQRRRKDGAPRDSDGHCFTAFRKTHTPSTRCTCRPECLSRDLSRA